MKYEHMRALRMGILCLGTALTSSPVVAQMTPAANPDKRPTLDQNGIDVISGNLVLADKQIGVGDLAFKRIWRNAGWYHNYVGVISASGASYTVRVGESVETFTLSGGTFTSDDGMGSTLTLSGGNYTYTLRDGTEMVFENPGTALYAFNAGVAKGLLNKITRPGGHITTLKYRYQGHCLISEQGPNCTPQYIVRLQSVFTNTGHQLHFDYFGPVIPTTTKMDSEFVDLWQQIKYVTAINNTVDRCDPDANGNCNTLTQTWPRATITTYDGGSFKTDSLSDVLGNTTTVTLAGTSFSLASPQDSASDITLALSGGRVTSVARGGGTWSYGYSDAGGQRTTTIGQPMGGNKVYVSEIATRKLLSYTDELGKTTSYTYDAQVRPTRVTAPEGNYVHTTLDARGNATEVRAVAKSGSGLSDIVTTASFVTSCTNIKTCNQPTSTTDAKGFVTDYTYNSSTGQLTSITLPAATSGGTRPKTDFGYTGYQGYYKNSAGSIVASGQTISLLTSTSTCQTLSSCSGQADEVKTEISYGPQTAGTGNNLLPVSQTVRNGNSTLVAASTATYDVRGNVLTVDGPLSGSADTTRWHYDTGGRLVGIVAPDPDGGGVRLHQAQRFTYNADGVVTKVEIGTVSAQTDGAWSSFGPSQETNYTYDTLGRPLIERVAAGGTTFSVRQTSYDNGGRVDCTAIRMNPAVFSSLPASACTLGTTGSDGPDRVTKMGYDNASHVTSVTESYGVSGEQAVVQTSTFSNNGLLATIKDGENNLTTYEYDGFDRLLKTRFPLGTKGANASSTTDYEQLTYDANGNVTTRRLRDGNTLGMSYDNLNRRITLGGSTIADRTYGYDLLGRMTASTITGNNWTLGYSYDALGRVLSQTTPHGSLGYEYDLAGRRTKIIWPDSYYAYYAYDVTGNVTAVHSNSTTSQIFASYAYDSLGRRTGVSYSNGTTRSYAFDPVSRLEGLQVDLAGTNQDLLIGKVSASGTSIAYNPASQIKELVRSNDAYAWGAHVNLTRSYTANGLNQYSQTVSTPPSGSPVTTSYGYDGRGNLTSVGSTAYTYNGLNELLTAPNVAMTYDPIGRLMYQTAGGVTTRFLHDGGNVIAELDGANAILRRYIPGPGVDEPIVWVEGSGFSDQRYLHADERGSIVAVTNNTGATIAINSYDEYGNPAATNLGRFQYTGQAWLPEAGIYYYKARMYSPSLGRFLQTDPIGYGDGMNMYAYVGNDPVNYLDPTGMDDEPTADEAETIIITGRKQKDDTPPTREALARAGKGGTRGGHGSGGGQNKPQKEQPKQEDKYACLKAVGGGALDGVIDPQALIGDALTAGAWGAAKAGTVARAALPLGRALNFAKASVPGLVLSVTIQAAAGGAYAYFTDPRCK